jgi:hypothetical protein
VEVSEPLKESSATTTGRRRSRYNPLVIVEVALSLVLLMGAALLTKAVARRSQAFLGYDRTGLLDARVGLSRRYGGDTTEATSRDLLSAVEAVSGVRSAAALDIYHASGRDFFRVTSKPGRSSWTRTRPAGCGRMAGRSGGSSSSEALNPMRHGAVS